MVKIDNDKSIQNKYDKRYSTKRTTTKEGLPIQQKEVEKGPEVDEEALGQLKELPIDDIVTPKGSDMNNYAEEIKKTFCVERINGEVDYYHDIERVVADQGDGLIHLYNKKEQVAFYRVKEVAKGLFL